MRRVIAVNNARHEAGHWITGWILEKASKDIVVAVDSEGDSYCDSVPHPDFLNLHEINTHLGNRIINLLGGVRAESLVNGEFNNEIYKDQISNYKRAWPDYFVASELFRYYYRSMNPSVRKSYENEWNLLVEETDKIIKQYEFFINNVSNEVLLRIRDNQSTVTISQADILNILESHSGKASA